MKLTVNALLLAAISTGIFVGTANAEYSQTDTKPAIKDESAYWEAKKIEMQAKSTEMRIKKVEEYKAKGIDVSAITPELLDGTKTDESKFWEAMKMVMNQHEMVIRKEFVEKARSKGMDVSMFTEEVMNDGEKFWEIWTKISEEQMKIHVDKYKEDKKKHGTSKEYTTGNKERSDINKNEMSEKKPGQTKIKKMPSALSSSAKNRLIKALKAVPEDKKAATLEAMRATIMKKMEVTKSKITLRKLEETLKIAEEYLVTKEEEIDDDALIDELLK